MVALRSRCGHYIFTGSVARSAMRRYLIYSEADFEVLRPAWATRCTDGGPVHMTIREIIPGRQQRVRRCPL